MSAADEDTELRDLLVQTLDKNGILGKIKAELRASIFLALEAQEQNKAQNPLKNTNLQKFVATEDGQMCIGVINQFLEHFHLDYTTAVFKPEGNASDTIPGEKEIRKSLNLEPSVKSPLLSQILQVVKSGRPATHGLEGHQIQYLRSKFYAFDHTSTGSIDRKDVTTVINHACPLMNADMVDKFVADELKSVYTSSITFDAFLNLFQKFYEMCTSVMSIGSQSKLPPLSATHQSLDNNSSSDSYYLKQSAPFHQVPASPTPMSEPEPKHNTLVAESGGIPSAYLMPTSTRVQDGGMDVGYDPFFDSQPGKEPGATDGARGRDPLYTDTPAISPDSSKGSSDWPNKKFKTEESAGQHQYDDDFHSEQSISEDIQDMGDDLLQSSGKDESLDLTEDRTVSEIPHADYMEDIRHG